VVGVQLVEQREEKGWVVAENKIERTDGMSSQLKRLWIPCNLLVIPLVLDATRVGPGAIATDPKAIYAVVGPSFVLDGDVSASRLKVCVCKR
jgi:hypothetical protein